MIVRAPWTDEQVELLKTFQAADYMHPFTCPIDHGVTDTGDRRLAPTVHGWVCPHCTYTQDWCHDWMFETWLGRPMVPIEELLMVAKEFRRVWVESGLNPDDLPGDVLSGALSAVLAMHKRMVSYGLRDSENTHE